STRRFATLGAGSRDGVASGMPVRAPQGLLGRVLEVGPSTARILLITDSESVVPVRRARDGVPAFAQGTGDGRLRLRLINLGINPIRKGDAFVTSGSGGLYPPGIPVAIVTQITSDGAIANPASDPATSDLVLVEQAWSARIAPPNVAGRTP
ncbi:MAG TPA: rod shape-determining protein MreC, partial [Novosphingobium sp.]|nr:rod shape-determining protein MreC [Novosphingobium sp.]